jgi:hypothetical protein
MKSSMDINAISAHRNAIPLISSVCNENKGNARTYEVGAILASPEFRTPKNPGKSAKFLGDFLVECEETTQHLTRNVH